MEVKKKPNWFLRILYLLLIMFLVVYVVGESGYYESTLHNETILTEDAIERFEKDVAEGKDISVEDYVIENETDYSNKVTDIGDSINDNLIVLFTDGLTHMGNILKTLFT